MRTQRSVHCGRPAAVQGITAAVSARSVCLTPRFWQIGAGNTERFHPAGGVLHRRQLLEELMLVLTADLPDYGCKTGHRGMGVICIRTHRKDLSGAYD